MMLVSCKFFVKKFRGETVSNYLWEVETLFILSYLLVFYRYTLLQMKSLMLNLQPCLFKM
jgi:hypothetical protein